jgi:Zn-dependent protease with chaperone function
MSKGTSFFERACLALALMALFYILTILLALFLLVLPVALTGGPERPAPLVWIYVFCWPLGLVVLLSLRPRRNNFRPPGILLAEEQSPRLFAMLRRVADAAKQPMPEEVCLSLDFEAGVMQRGDVMGLGGIRVLIIGLPLAGVLGERELESVLAHEFGHYSGGDAALGSLVHTTHAAIERMVESLDGRALQLAYLLACNLFLRLTRAVSRQQEFAADRAAAELCGARAHASALLKITRCNPLFTAYMNEQFMPLALRNFTPQMLAGFNAKLGAPSSKEFLDKPIDDMIAERSTANSYSTHPSLRQRLEALGVDAAAITASALAAEDSAPRAIALFDDLDALERRLLDATLTPPKDGSERVHIKWEDVFKTCFEPEWEEGLRPFAAELEALAMRDIGALATDKERLKNFFKEKLPAIDETAWIRAAARLLGAAVSCALVARGAAGSVRPGRPTEVACNGKAIAPFELLFDLVEGRATAEQWSAGCDDLGIGGIPLSICCAPPKDSDLAASG